MPVCQGILNKILIKANSPQLKTKFIKMDLSINREYVSGMTFKTEAIRKYKHTCESKDPCLNGLVFYSETLTKKKKGFYSGWGVGKTTYYLEKFENEFKTIGKLCDYVKNKIK